MTVWKVVPDFRFQSFYTSDPDSIPFAEVEYTKQLMNCEPMLANWRPLKLLEDNAKRRLGNFARSWGGGFLIDARAHEVLSQMPAETFELLPLLPHKNQILHVLNLLLCVDCLDRDRCKHTIEKTSGTQLSQIEKYYFVTERIPKSMLFRLPKRSSLFTTTGLDNPGLEFKTIVEREMLTGLKFEELWSDVQ